MNSTLQGLSDELGALPAKSAGVVPAYLIMVDTILDGIDLSDGAITRDCNERCYAPTRDLR